MSIEYGYLADLSLRCKDKNKGRMISGNYRLHYDRETRHVSLWQRPYTNDATLEDFYDEKRRILTVYPDSTARLLVSNDMLDNSVRGKMFEFLSISTRKIPTMERRYYPHAEHKVTSRDGTEYYYIPGKILFDRERNVIEASDVLKVNITPEFTKLYTQLSKKFRANLQVTCNFLPAEMTDNKAIKAMGFVDPTKHMHQIWHDIQMKKPMDAAGYMRWLHYADSARYWRSKHSVQKLSQKLLNQLRYPIATMIGEVTTEIIRQPIK